MLAARHPADGSQVSKLSGVARSKAYNVIGSMADRFLVGAVGEGMFAALPPVYSWYRAAGKSTAC